MWVNSFCLAVSAMLVTLVTGQDATFPPNPGYPPCNVCGANKTVTAPDGLVYVPTMDAPVTCNLFFFGGMIGYIDPTYCPATVLFTTNCSCQLGVVPVDSSSPSTLTTPQPQVAAAVPAAPVTGGGPEAPVGVTNAPVGVTKAPSSSPNSATVTSPAPVTTAPVTTPAETTPAPVPMTPVTTSAPVPMAPVTTLAPASSSTSVPIPFSMAPVPTRTTSAPTATKKPSTSDSSKSLVVIALSVVLGMTVFMNSLV